MPHKKPMLIIFVLLLVAGAILSACSPGPTPVQAAGPSEPPPVPVQVAVVERGRIAEVLTYAGNLQPVRSVVVTAGYTDRIIDLPVGEGDRVEAGDLLLAFDTATLSGQVRQAEAALTAAEAQLAKMERGARPEQVMAAQAALNLARANLDGQNTASDARIEAAAGNVAQAQAALKLAQAEYDEVSWAGQVGMLPQALALEQATVAYETAMAGYTAAVEGAPIERLALEATILQAESALALTREPFVREDYVMAEAAVEQARAALAILQTQFEQAQVNAPISGVVTARHVVPGQKPLPGSPLFTLVSDQIEVILPLEEGHLAEVEIGQPAAIRVAAYPGRDFPAAVRFISPTADAKTHTFTVKVIPVDEADLLRGGMFAEVSLLKAEKPAALLIPQAALRQSGDRMTVFVVAGEQVTERAVSPGLRTDGRIEIRRGLAEGERVVIAGQAGLSDGSRVSVMEVNR